jgi:sugar lactone lactonase YvrE
LAFTDAHGRVQQRIAAPGANREGARFNDGKVDRAGRFWASTLDASGSTDNHLYRLDATAIIHVMQSNVQNLNGIG